MSEEPIKPMQMKQNINVKSEEFHLNPNMQQGLADQNIFRQSTENILKLKETKIQDVYQDNFIQELKKIMELSQTYNIIAMDTEFPGVNYQFTSEQQKMSKDQEFYLIYENVKRTKIIQIGISIADENGKVPTPVSTWQFNFNFDFEKDSITKDSFNLLKTAGIDFERFKEQGIDPQLFSEYMTASVLNDDVKWVVFHGGFDFSYFLQMLYGQHIPDDVEKFYEILKTFFPTIYDIKCMIKDYSNLKDAGLSKIATELKVNRIGPQHQAGSDSFVTLAIFFKLKEVYFKNEVAFIDQYKNMIYNIGKGQERDHIWAKGQPLNSEYDAYNNPASFQYNQMIWWNQQNYLHFNSIKLNYFIN